VLLILFLLYFPSPFPIVLKFHFLLFFPLFLVIFSPPYVHFFYSSCCFISSFVFYFFFYVSSSSYVFLLVTRDWNSWLLQVKTKRRRMPYPSQFCCQRLRGIHFGYPCGV
jgi:hypothetical protein